MTETSNTVIFDRHNIRIYDHDTKYWRIDWAYEGDRKDLCGTGWVAQVTAYDPTAKFKFVQTFVDKQTKLVEKSEHPMILRYGKIYQGGSKYAHDKYGGKDGFVVIKAGAAMGITAADAVSTLASSKCAMNTGDEGR